MTIEKQNEIKEELQAVFTKHGIRCAAYCGKTGDEYVGAIGINCDTKEEQMTAVICVGRLWQSAREQMRSWLDKFERQ